MVPTVIPQERCDFYVYVIFRPNGAPCYVGKGRGKRWDEHFRGARNPHLANIIASSSDLLPKIKVRSELSEKNAFALEMALIGAIGRKVDGGPLVNMTDGGEGARGARHTEEFKASQRAVQLGRKKSAATLERMSLAQKKRCDGVQFPWLSQKGRKSTPETIRKISARAKELGWQPPSRRGTVTPDEVRQKQSKSMKLAMAAKRAAKCKGQMALFED